MAFRIRCWIPASDNIGAGRSRKSEARVTWKSLLAESPRIGLVRVRYGQTTQSICLPPASLETVQTPLEFSDFTHVRCRRTGRARRHRSDRMKRCAGESVRQGK